MPKYELELTISDEDYDRRNLNSDELGAILKFLLQPHFPSIDIKMGFVHWERT